jgi:lipoprotein-anchoring transpeptidase ErfK/SrfK
MGAASASLAVTLIAALGGLGFLPSAAETPPASDRQDGAVSLTGDDLGRTPTSERSDRRTPTPAGGSEARAGAAEAALPARSGHGRRVVFSESRQRVWLVDRGDEVLRTYPVSGSRADNLDPGTYAVYSRSEDALGIDGSTMRWFVRFTQGEKAAIGFHDIPLLDGEREQTVAQLGTPRSHGCIRQRTPDAKAMWDFAQLDTPVVVVN